MTKRDYKYAIMAIGIIFAWLMMMFFAYINHYQVL